MGGCRTVETITAPEGCEFKFTERFEGWPCAVERADNYSVRCGVERGVPYTRCAFTVGNTVHKWLNPTIELVKIAKPEPAVQFFEFGWPVEGKKGDLIHIDRNGHWELRRSHPQVLESPTYTTVASGGSFIWSGV